MLNKWLFTRIDNSALIVFRILFGLLLAIEAIGAIFTGWVKRAFIEPDFTFNFIGFNFLQPLPGNGMLWYYAIMGLFGIFVMLGYKYRLSIFMYTIMWAAVYLMQKSSYNNHYYLLMLLCFLMILLPAHRYASIDVWKKPELKKLSMPSWVWILLVVQMTIVYTYAAVAKIYPDWFDATLPGILMSARRDYWLIGDFLQQTWVHYTIAWFGFLFDLLIIPLLLWKRTRIFAFLAAVFFHLFNSLIFHIGIFPYLALAFTIFFFPTEKINRIFLRKKPHYSGNEVEVPEYKTPLLVFFGIWFVVQLALPVRHWFFKDDVLWTEEGHRLSWRMMLRSKAGRIQFKVVDKARPQDTIFVQTSRYLSPKQQRAVSTKPDMIWQFSQRLEEEFELTGKEVEIYVDSKVSVNGRPYQPFIDPKVDLAAKKWNHFGHHDWILPSSIE
ncbi:HTTM domain-containing protein [Salinimicrobium sediminilitoris]|uniref:HTTM domain-containing protein n=1 Tax=Salinimicrobium sediminilitoris TaxID=2876715 RepID=UPI001E475A0B|nr:HTTM domain-containing protein [Salinimicrobium sediminilitoris]MCC8359702.1 HTTM domain-containing protein [Salinimicrobium sediminilitoris]